MGTHKILVVTKGFALGGAERLLVDALPYLDRSKFTYEFARLLRDSDFLEQRFRTEGFPTHNLGMRRNADIGLGLVNLMLLQSREKFDLIHSHLPLPGILARVVGRLYQIPVIHTEHNLPQFLHPLSRFINGLTIGKNHVVFGVSHHVTDAMTELGWNRSASIVPLQNGVPVEHIRSEAANSASLKNELGVPETCPVICNVAVLTRQKRLDDWLAVAASVQESRKDVYFVLAGSGPEEEMLRITAQSLPDPSRLLLLGFRPDGRRVLGMADILLMTSEFEGLPVTLLEAMALGLPVVASGVGGIPEVVRDRIDGFLCAVGSTQEMADHCIRLLDSQSQRQKMGAAAAQRIADCFHVETRVKRIESAYISSFFSLL